MVIAFSLPFTCRQEVYACLPCKQILSNHSSYGNPNFLQCEFLSWCKSSTCLSHDVSDLNKSIICSPVLCCLYNCRYTRSAWDLSQLLLCPAGHCNFQPPTSVLAHTLSWPFSPLRCLQHMLLTECILWKMLELCDCLLSPCQHCGSECLLLPSNM